MFPGGTDGRGGLGHTSNSLKRKAGVGITENRLSRKTSSSVQDPRAPAGRPHPHLSASTPLPPRPAQYLLSRLMFSVNLKDREKEVNHLSLRSPCPCLQCSASTWGTQVTLHAGATRQDGPHCCSLLWTGSCLWKHPSSPAYIPQEPEPLRTGAWPVWHPRDPGAYKSTKFTKRARDPTRTARAVGTPP